MTMPAAPAEARRETPYWRTPSKVIRAADTVTTAMIVSATRCRMRDCVTCLRARRLSSESSLEAAQVNDEPDVERRDGDPAHEEDDPHHDEMAQRRRFRARQRGDRGGEACEDHDQCKARRTAGARHERAPEQVLLADEAYHRVEQDRMDPPGDQDSQADEAEADRPVRQERQGLVDFVQGVGRGVHRTSNDARHAVRAAVQLGLERPRDCDSSREELRLGACARRVRACGGRCRSRARRRPAPAILRSSRSGTR